MSEYYASDGRPITQDEWLKEWSGENKRVAKETVGEVDVSPVCGLPARHEGRCTPA